MITIKLRIHYSPKTLPNPTTKIKATLAASNNSYGIFVLHIEMKGKTLFVNSQYSSSHVIYSYF